MYRRPSKNSRTSINLVQGEWFFALGSKISELKKLLIDEGSNKPNQRISIKNLRFQAYVQSVEWNNSLFSGVTIHGR